MDKIIDGCLIINSIYNAETISMYTDALSEGLITEIYVDTNRVTASLEIFKGLNHKCALQSLHICTSHTNFEWLNYIISYVKSGVQLITFSVALNSITYNNKIFEIIQHSKLHNLIIRGTFSTISVLTRYIKNNDSLQTLGICNCYIDSDFIQALSTNIHTLKLYNVICDNAEIIAYLRKASVIKKFSVLYRGNEYRTSIFPVQDMFNAISQNDSIEYLKVCLNITDSISDILRYIGSTRVLKSLNLYNLTFEQHATDIFNALSANNIIQSLTMTMRKFDSTIFKSIYDMLIVNTSLQMLDLPLSNVCGEGAMLIADALIINCTLVSLNIEYNNITTDGTLSIARMLSVNDSLTKLNIGGAKMDDVVMNVMIESLKHNTSLRELYISYTDNIANMILVNNTLEILYIDDRHNKGINVSAICKALESNYSITDLTLLIRLDSLIKASIKTLLKRNIGIRNRSRFIKTKALLTNK